MQRTLVAGILLFAPAIIRSEQLLSTTDGTSWTYEMVQEAGEGVTFSDLKPAADGKVHLPAIYRVGGTQNIDGKELRKFEAHRAGVVSQTDLLAVDDQAMTCYARIMQDGQMLKMDPPQKMLVAPIKTGTKWEYDGTIADEKVHQEYRIATEEDVQVPAGKFHAFRIHMEQPEELIVVDRWYVPNVGFVKDVTTVTKPNGGLLERISLELKERPKLASRPEVKPTEVPKKLSVGLASERLGEVTTEFKADLPQIFARWQGHALPDHAKIRLLWIAEDVGDAAVPNYKIDETSVDAKDADAFGTFTLSRPNKGWPVGKYRAEFYVGDELAETVKFTIAK
jgi:hypothetical protein